MIPQDKNFQSIVEVLRWRAKETPNQVAIRFLADGENESDSITYQQLDAKARAVAYELAQKNEPGDRVLLCYPPGIEFICGFLGCLYARMVAVPIYPPGNQRGLSRFQSVIKDCQSHVILSDSKGMKKLSASPELAGQTWLDTEVLDRNSASYVPDTCARANEVAFLQYTSGSTGTPKGVMVTHGNILANLRMLGDAVRADEQTASVSWLPVYHDMGLVAGVLLPLYAGYPGILFPPVAFIEKPLRWLQAVSRYRASFITSPNFAYDLLLRKLNDEDVQNLDLSCLEVVANAAEPVRAETLFRFQDRFARFGLKPNILLPSYGLAEATLIVSGKYPRGAAPTTLKVVREALDEGRIEKNDEPGAKVVVGCGEICIGQTVAIVDTETALECAPGRVGEIWVSGGHIALGYWNRPKQSEEEFHAKVPSHPGKNFLKTGDLGFIEAGNLYITGRLKDMMILYGRNFYPQDIEQSVESSTPTIRPGSCVAVAVEGARGDELCVIAEISRSALKDDLAKVAEIVQRAVGVDHELSCSQIHFLKPGGLPKTTSGKLQRKYTAQLVTKQEIPSIFRWPLVEEKNVSEKVNTSEPAETVVQFLLSEVQSQRPLPEKVLLACMKLAPEVFLRNAQKTVATPTPLKAVPQTEPVAPVANDDISKVRAQLVKWFATAAEMSPDKIDPTKALATYGLDSLMAYELGTRIKENFDINVPNTLLWDHPTLNGVAEFLVKQMKKRAA